jgi:hypothetical protein
MILAYHYSCVFLYLTSILFSTTKITSIKESLDNKTYQENLWAQQFNYPLQTIYS